MYEDNNYRPFGEEYRNQAENPNPAPTPNPIPEPKPKKKKSGSGFFKKFILAIVLGLIFGIFVGTGIYAVNLFTASFDISKKDNVSVAEDIKPKEKEIETVKPDREEGKAEDSFFDKENPFGDIIAEQPKEEKKVYVMDASDVAESCMPSIVAITNISTETYQSFFGTQTAQSESSGSGIIVGENDDELLIATNSHVVSGSEKLTVQFIDGESVGAYVKGTEEEVDLAIIAVKLSDIKKETKGEIKVAKLGDSDELRVGEPAIAIGNALGYGQSVTCGVISALGREVKLDNVDNTLIQTDAAINPGNSGGALLNIHGEVIGINEIKIASTSVEGVGYAIPISSAEPILDELMNRKTRDKVDEHAAGYLGIAGVDVSADISAMYDMPEGVYIASVDEDTAADKADLKKGYVITRFDGVRVSSMESLKDRMQYYEAGETVDVTVQVPGEEGYTEKVVSVTLGKKPE